MDLTEYAMQISERVPHGTDEYIGDDGLLRCGVCHAQTQTRVSFLGIDKVVRCICDCRVKEMQAEKEKERARDREYNRRICFGDTSLAHCTFENDSRDNEKLSDAMIRYTEQFPDFLKEGRGILLSGTVGTGKSYLAACVANRLIDKDYKCLMVNFSTLINKIQESFDKRQQIIDNLNSYPLLILDDLGAERKTEYMQEQVFNIIDARYRTGLPFIITTNIPLNEIKKPSSTSEARIYDRILERCFPIEVNGVSKRRQAVKSTYADTKERLGL